MTEPETSPGNGAKQKRQKPKIRGLTIFPLKIKGVDSWRVVTPKTGGGRWVKTFRDEKKARGFYEQQYDLVRNAGLAGFSLSEHQRVDAQVALEILTPFGVTLQQAAQFYALQHEAIVESQTVTEAIRKLLEAKEADCMSARYRKDLRNRLDRFAQEFGERKIASVIRPEIGDWLRNLNLAPLTRNTFYLRLSALFSYAVEQRWASENPLSKKMRAKVIGAEPGILTPDQFAKLLEAAGPDTLPYWAIGGFAGLRAAELERLEWSDVDFEAELIEVTPRKSKTASRRHVTIQPALKAWLEPYRDRISAQLCPLNLRVKLESDRERAGIAKWPVNALRHSYASYHLAHFGNAAKLALELGHSDSDMVFDHYRQRVRPALAKVWWSILPQASAHKIVRLSA
jgi:integrase